MTSKTTGLAASRKWFGVLLIALCGSGVSTASQAGHDYVSDEVIAGAIIGTVVVGLAIAEGQRKRHRDHHYHGDRRCHTRHNRHHSHYHGGHHHKRKYKHHKRYVSHYANHGHHGHYKKHRRHEGNRHYYHEKPRYRQEGRRHSRNSSSEGYVSVRSF